MSILKSETHADVSIVTETTVLTYAHGADKQPITVLPRIAVRDVQGGVNYIAKAMIDGDSVTPPSYVTFRPGQTRGVLQGRHVAFRPGDVLTLSLQGAAGDAHATIVADLFNSTPVQAEDIENIVGGGATPVDHNYGGTDKYRYTTAGGAGISDGVINIYLASDYNAGRRGAEFVKASSRTDVDGRWERPVNLDPGNYIVYFYKQQAFGPDIATLNVTG